jgi:hypothetical protein
MYLTLETVISSTASVHIYQYARCHISDDSNIKISDFLQKKSVEAYIYVPKILQTKNFYFPKRH